MKYKKLFDFLQLDDLEQDKILVKEFKKRRTELTKLNKEMKEISERINGTGDKGRATIYLPSVKNVHKMLGITYYKARKASENKDKTEWREMKKEFAKCLKDKEKFKQYLDTF